MLNTQEIERLRKALIGYEVCWELFWKNNPHERAEAGHAYAMDGFLRSDAELILARQVTGKVPTSEPGIVAWEDTGKRETVIERDVRERSEADRVKFEAYLAGIRAGAVRVVVQ